MLDDKVKTDPGLRQQWLRSIEDCMARISPSEVEDILAKYNIFDEQISTGEQGRRLKAIRQTSIAYGRLLEKYHSDRRESQITGSIYGPAVYASYATASPVPLVGAGLVHIGRKGYRAIVGRKGMVNLEFDENDPVNGDLQGRDGGPIIPASLARKRGGAGIYQHAVLVQCAGKTHADLTEPQKYWYKHIDLQVSRPRYASTRWKKPEDLAVYCAGAVQKDLTKIKAPKTAQDQDKIQQAEGERKFAADQHRHALDSYQNARTAMIRTGASLDAKKKELAPLLISASTTQEQQKKAELEVQILSLRSDLAVYKDDIKRAKKYVTDTEEKLKNTDESVKKLKEDKTLRNLDLAEVGRNLDIQRAFAVKIQEEFTALKVAGWNVGTALGKGAKAVVTSGSAKTAAKDIGEVALATSFFGGAAYGAAIYTGAVSAPAAGVIVGGAVLTAKVYQKLKKWTVG